jgi:hypothetical protein
MYVSNIRTNIYEKELIKADSDAHCPPPPPTEKTKRNYYSRGNNRGTALLSGQNVKSNLPFLVDSVDSPLSHA